MSLSVVRFLGPLTHAALIAIDCQLIYAWYVSVQASEQEEILGPYRDHAPGQGTFTASLFSCRPLYLHLKYIQIMTENTLHTHVKFRVSRI